MATALVLATPPEYLHDLIGRDACCSDFAQYSELLLDARAVFQILGAASLDHSVLLSLEGCSNPSLPADLQVSDPGVNLVIGDRSVASGLRFIGTLAEALNYPQHRSLTDSAKSLTDSANLD